MVILNLEKKMWRKLLMLFVAIMITVPSSVFSQDDDLDKLEFEDRPLQDQKIQYFALTFPGGYTASFLFTNFNELNSVFSNYQLNELKSPIFMHGYQVFASAIIIPKVRFEFQYMSGSASTGEKKMTIDKDDQNYDVTRTGDFTVSFTGLGLHYPVVLFKSFVFVPGLNFGIGSANINLSQAESMINWSKFQPNGDAINFTNTLSSSYYYILPNLSFEYKFTDVSVIRLNAGYSLSFMGDWTMHGTAEASGVPKNINASGFMLQAGIFLGLFNY